MVKEYVLVVVNLQIVIQFQVLRLASQIFRNIVKHQVKLLHAILMVHVVAHQQAHLLAPLPFSAIRLMIMKIQLLYVIRLLDYVEAALQSWNAKNCQL